MSDTNRFSDMRYDFSGLSKSRLRTYNMLAEELERQEAARSDDGTRLSDDDLDLIAAAGIPTQCPDKPEDLLS